MFHIYSLYTKQDCKQSTFTQKDLFTFITGLIMFTIQYYTEKACFSILTKCPYLRLSHLLIDILLYR